MLIMNLQLFAHKKGVGSSKNGRDSESKRLGVKAADGEFVLDKEEQRFTQELMLVRVEMILYLLKKTELLDLKEWVEIRKKLAFTQ